MGQEIYGLKCYIYHKKKDIVNFNIQKQSKKTCYSTHNLDFIIFSIEKRSQNDKQFIRHLIFLLVNCNQQIMNFIFYSL